MIGYTFKVPGDERVFLLTRIGDPRVFDLGPSVRGMSAAGAAARLGREWEYRQADDDVAAWGRLILAGRQGGRAPIVGQHSIDDRRSWLRDLPDREFEALISAGGGLP